jgi:hypothetical protein
MARTEEIIGGLDGDYRPRYKGDRFKIDHGNVFNIKPIRSSDFAPADILAEAEAHFLETRYEKYELQRENEIQVVQEDLFGEPVVIKQTVKHQQKYTHEEILEAQSDFIRARVKAQVFNEQVFTCELSYRKTGKEPSFETFTCKEDLIEYVQLVGHGKQIDLSKGRKSKTKWCTPDGITVKVEGCTFDEVWD